MKKYKVVVETGYTLTLTDYFEVEDDTTDEEIEELANEVKENLISWNYYDVK